MELCCSSPLHQRCVGQAGSSASGQEKAPGGMTDLASCLLPLPAPSSGEVRVFCCSSQIHPDSLGPSPSPGFVHSQWWLFPSPQTCWEDAARVRWSMVCSCQALPEMLPVLFPRVLPHCPAVRGRAGTWTPPMAQPLSPIPTPQKGEVSLKRKSAPCLSFYCSSHIFSAAGSTSP